MIEKLPKNRIYPLSVKLKFQRTAFFHAKQMLVFLFSVFLSLAAFSQTVEIEKSTRIEKHNGKEYYIHTVVKGQTLYSISKAYNVLISEIIFENPAAIDGIKPNMELKISVASNSLNSVTQNEKAIEISGKHRIHTVEKGQTVYSISKMYNITVEELKRANPDMGEAISIGQKLRIPVEQLIKPGETVFTSVVKENLADTVILPVFDSTKFNAVMLLPLFLGENQTEINTSQDVIIQESINEKSLNALEFYEGALLAADTLNKAGMNAVLYVYDIPDDKTLAKVLNNIQLKKADVIIGPFFGKRFEQVAAFARTNKIPCVTPVLRKNDIIVNNPFASKVMPSPEMEIRQTGEFIGRWHCDKNIMVVHNGTFGDSLLAINLLRGVKRRCADSSFHILNTKGHSIKIIDSLLTDEKENIVVALSKDQNYVSRLVLHLEKKNKAKLPRMVTLFGLAEWQDFENIEIEYFLNLNLHIPVDLYVDYSRPEVKKFRKYFLDKYLAEPGEYALLGYDVTFYYLSVLHKHGKDFFTNPSALHATGLQSNFEFEKISPEGGLENRSIFILNYKDYRLVKAN